MHVQTHMLDALQGYGHDVLRILITRHTQNPYFFFREHFP